MNHLIICNTPYQVFNTINILANDIEIKHFDVDIVIDESFNSFKDARIIGKRLLDLALCRNVFYSKIKKQFKPKSKIDTIRYLSQRDHTNEYYFSDKRILNTNYDTVWVGDTNYLGCSMIQRNNQCEPIWYDDGLSSYSKSPRAYGMSGFKKRLFETLKIGSYGYSVGKLYLNNKEIAVIDEFDVIELPLLDGNNEATTLIQKIFEYDDSLSEIKNHRFCALVDGQMLEGVSGFKGIDYEALIMSLGILESDVVIRKHPRDKREYTRLVVDEGHNMWEVECIKSLKNEHVLLSCFSTAMLTPKLIAGKEPYLIFLYKILLEKKCILYTDNEKMINKVRELYIDKTKIFVPENMKELQNIIKLLK